jgi:hypothetical protein
LMQDENYLRASIGAERRPLLFVFVEPKDVERILNGPSDVTRESLNALRAESVARGLGNPYVVIVLSDAKKAEWIRRALAGDAISQYVAGRRKGRPETWAEFEPSIEADWSDYAKSTSADVVPTLRSGADIRARCLTPPPFEHRFPPGSACDDFVANPTLDELASEFQHARQWAEAHIARDPARLLLVYAWSECDESGNCLMPTYGDPAGRKLDAIARGLAQ